MDHLVPRSLTIRLHDTNGGRATFLVFNENENQWDVTIVEAGLSGDSIVSCMCWPIWFVEPDLRSNLHLRQNPL